MIARSEDNLKRLESKYPNTKAYPCDVADIALLKKKIKKIENDMGRPEVPKLVDWYMDGKIEIDPMITHKMPLEDINN